MTRGTGTAGLALAALLTAGCVGSSVGGSSGDRRQDAYYMCQQFAEERLKAPSTADWPNWYEHEGVTVTGTGEGPYVVLTHVDAENSFGAKIRDEVFCKVRHVSGDTWRLQRINIG